MDTVFETIIDEAVTQVETETFTRREAYFILHNLHANFDTSASEMVMKNCLRLLVEMSRSFDREQSLNIHKPFCQITAHVVKQINDAYKAIVPQWWENIQEEFPEDEREDLTARVMFFDKLGVLMGDR